MLAGTFTDAAEDLLKLLREFMCLFILAAVRLVELLTIIQSESSLQTEGNGTIVLLKIFIE